MEQPDDRTVELIAAIDDGKITRIAGFQENASPRVKRIESRLAEMNCQVPLDLREWWLCASKSFRFLERNLWVIGMGRSPEDAEDIPGFLQCEDTYPNQDEVAAWYASFCRALNGWWGGQSKLGHWQMM